MFLFGTDIERYARMGAILGGLVGASHSIDSGRDGMVAPRSHRAGHQAKSDSLVKVSVKHNIMWLSKTILGFE